MAKPYTVKQIHKKMYPATYNFKDEADGTTGTSITGITTEGGTDSTYSATVVGLEDGHRKVVKFLAAGDNGTNAYWASDFTDVNGIVTFEFIMKYIDNGQGYWRFAFWNEASVSICYGRFNSATNQFQTLSGNGAGGNTTTSTAAAADTWHHIRVQINTTTDTYSVWLNGTQVLTDQNFQSDRTATSVINVLFYLDNGGGANALEGYLDAFGDPNNDANYKIGDNVDWRHYKESTDSFEGDDVGTQGTSITWVDAVDTAASIELVPEFNEHKKVLRGYYSSGAGGNDYCYHTLGSESTTGWWAGWIKADDAGDANGIEIRLYGSTDANDKIRTRIANDKFQHYTAAAWADSGLAATDATYFFIYIQWYADSTFDFWINNILYEDGTANAAVIGNGINRVYLYFHDTDGYAYLDAPMSSLDSDVRGDNRTFDYNDSYTRDDITSDVLNVIYSNKLGDYRKCTLYSLKEWKALFIFQIYDVNSKLAFEGEIKNRIREGGGKYKYSLRDKNWDELTNRRSNTFTAAKIHDPTDSTCMLKTVLPTVGQEDGDLILVSADTKTDTYSPSTQYYPDMWFLTDLADIADSCIIIEANGKVHLDDDSASGTTLDVDVAIDKRVMVGDPRVTDILETINYFEIFGAINPETGTRFYKEIDNSGTDKKRRWRNQPNNNLRTQTDVDNYGAKLEARMIPVRSITLRLQGIGTHDMGTTMNYKFVTSIINIPQADYYIIEELINFDMNEHVIVLSEGMIEQSKYSATFERSQEYLDTHAAEIYETDLTTVYPPIFPGNGATYDVTGVVLNDSVAVEKAISSFYTPTTIDTSRDIEIIVTFYRGDANGDTVSVTFQVLRYPMNGALDTIVSQAVEFPACAGGEWEKYSYTIDSADVDSDYIYHIVVIITEAGRSISINSVSATYYLKRSV